MKRKVILFVIIGLLIICGITLITWNYNKGLSVITLDINPSVKITINKNEKVIKIEALNNDAKDIISNNLKGKKLDDTIKIIANNILEKGYIKEDKITILMHAEGNINTPNLEHTLQTSFNNAYIEIINVDKITKEDEILAKKYNISPAKAAYINSIKEDNENINIEDYASKQVTELKETKDTGNYCDEGYTLRGDFCYKEIDRKIASNGEICPREYREYEGKCYREGRVIDTGEIHCRDGYELQENECVRKEIRDAEPTGFDCGDKKLARKSELGFFIGSGKDDYVCYSTEGAKKPTLRCLLNKGHKIINGECYNGPAPLINGGCPGADKPIDGWCYSKDDGDQWECPNGNIYEKSKGNVPEYCPDTIKYVVATPSGYKCEDNGNLKGELQDKKCIYTFNEPPVRNHLCEEGYTKVEGDTCLDMKDTKSKQNGFVCEDENTELAGKNCIVYDIKEAKK